MLISEKKNFIFIHIYKTAGTSVKHALIPLIFPQWQIFIYKSLKKLNVKPPRSIDYSPLFKHCTAQEVIDVLGRDKFETYFSFGFVRNSWDWQVSEYKYILRAKNHAQHEIIKQMDGFEEYIKWRCSRKVKFQKDFLYSNDNELLVDFVGRFENLENDFQKVCSEIGLKASLPWKNVSNTRSYQDFYSEETKKLVQDTYEKDIKHFNFKF